MRISLLRYLLKHKVWLLFSSLFKNFDTSNDKDTTLIQTFSLQIDEPIHNWLDKIIKFSVIMIMGLCENHQTDKCVDISVYKFLQEFVCLLIFHIDAHFLLHFSFMSSYIIDSIVCFYIITV